MRMIWLVAFAFANLAFRASATELMPLELEDWAHLLRNENWQPLFAPRSQTSLAMFMESAGATEVTTIQESLEKCGIKLASVTRTHFTSPPVPVELTISSTGSRSMIKSLEPLFAGSKVDHINMRVVNAKWTRLMSSETTSLVHATPIWSNPATRGPIVACVSQKAKLPLVESILKADVIVAAKDRRGRNVNVDSEISNFGTNNFLNGALKSRRFTYSIGGITLARRVGLCVDSLLFFRTPNGSLGAEDCSSTGNLQ